MLGANQVTSDIYTIPVIHPNQESMNSSTILIANGESKIMLKYTHQVPTLLISHQQYENNNDNSRFMYGCQCNCKEMEMKINVKYLNENAYSS